MEDVEEAWTGRQSEVFAEAVDSAHCEEHGYGRAESEEVAGMER